MFRLYVLFKVTKIIFMTLKKKFTHLMLTVPQYISCIIYLV